MAWISFGALTCRKQILCQLASQCCWNHARPWHASELVSFLVGLRTYQHPGIFVLKLRFLHWLWRTLRLVFVTAVTWNVAAFLDVTSRKIFTNLHGVTSRIREILLSGGLPPRRLYGVDIPPMPTTKLARQILFVSRLNEIKDDALHIVGPCHSSFTHFLCTNIFLRTVDLTCFFIVWYWGLCSGPGSSVGITTD